VATDKIVSIQDGLRLTVQAMVKQPTLIPKRILSDLEYEYIITDLLRTLPPTKSGMYQYDESSPLFADGDAAIVEEFGEIPIITGKTGRRKVAFTVKRALAMLVSQEMIDRNDVDAVNTQIKQIRNTFIRTWENAFFLGLANHPDVPSINADTPWSDPASTIRHDLTEAKQTIVKAAPADEPQSYFGFRPNTLVISETTETDLLLSDDFNKVFKDSAPQQDTRYTGTLPGTFFGMAVMRSRELDRLAPGKALLLERKTVGGIGDERPMQSTPMRKIEDNETYRSNTVRRSAIVIDQPKSACWINGVSV
jgi:hypothetical protein